VRFSVCWRLWRVRSVYGGIGGVGGVGGDTLYASMYAGRCGRYALFTEVLEISEVIRCVLLCMPEAVEGRLCTRAVCWRPWRVSSVRLRYYEVPEVIRCVLHCTWRVALFAGGDALYAAP